MKRRTGPADTTLASTDGAEPERAAPSDIQPSDPSVSALAHELRNTLMAIKWAAEFLSEELRPDDPSRTHLDLIQRAVEHGLATTEIGLPPDRGDPSTSEHLSTRLAGSAAGPTVLVVDDDDVLRRLIERMMDRLGYRPLLADSVAAAVAVAAAEPVDVVLTDIVLPDGTGPDAVAAIRVVSPGIQAVYMSGHSARSARAVSPLGESEDVLEKPFTVDSLSRAIDSVAPRPPAAAGPGPT